jgi:hypothetical protein
MLLYEERDKRGLATPGPAFKRALFELLGYRPHAAQWRAHESPASVIVFSGGVRAGKSYAAAMEAVAWLLAHKPGQPPPIVWLVGPSYALVRAEFSYIVEAAMKLGITNRRLVRMPADEYQPATLSTVYGGQVISRSAEDVRKLAALPADLVVLCEPGLMSEEAYHKARERAAERRGRVWLSGTLEQAIGWYTDLVRYGQSYPNPDDVFTVCAPTWENTAIYPRGLDDPWLQAQREALGERYFQERFGGQPIEPQTLVFGGLEIMRLVGDYPFDPSRPVEVAVDPGWRPGHGYAVLAIQPDDEGARVVDCVYLEQTPADKVIEACMHRPWWPYLRSGIIDIAGSQHQQGMPSQMEVWWRHGIALWGQKVPEKEGIDHLRMLLSQGRIRIDVRCQRLIYELTHWRYAEDKGTGNITDTPIDRECDCVKALIYWAKARMAATVATPLVRRRPVTFVAA